MIYRFIILFKKIFIIVAVLIVWMGGGQQQRPPRPADTALQTSLELLRKENNCSLNLCHIILNENWQQMKEVSFEYFLLLSPSSINNLHVCPGLVLQQDFNEPVMCNYSNIFYL